MTPLRRRMIEGMRLAGLTRSQAIYVAAVRRLAAEYRRAPDELSEEEVRAYLVKLRNRGAARGTFKVALCATQFLYERTLDRDGPLFSKKDSSAQAQTVAACAGRRTDPPSARLHKKPGSSRLPVARLCLRCAHQRGHSPGDRGDRSGLLEAPRHRQGNMERRVPLPQSMLAELGRMWKTHRYRRWLFPNRASTRR